jgi:hypothetical protein
MTAQGPSLLDDAGAASIATAFMLSHHGFRRDLALFAAALARLGREGDGPAAAARGATLAAEWSAFCDKLHGHHVVEDQNMFPGFRAQHPRLQATIDRLGADHRRIDPLLDEGRRAFAGLPPVDAATRVVAGIIANLRALLDEHLALEEAEVVPLLRAASGFPPPASDADVDLYAQGFAWACQGIAPEVLARLDDILPAPVRARLPAARTVYDAHFHELWGADARSGQSRTAIPDWLAV